MVKLGLDPTQPDLKQAREYFASVTVEQYIDHVLDLAHVSELVMTNDPFNPAERAMWERNEPCPERFHRALRMDPVLNDWETAHAVMAAAGFKTSADLTPQTVSEARRFLDLWIARLRPVYLAVSLPFTFTYPDDSAAHPLDPRGRSSHVPSARHSFRSDDRRVAASEPGPEGCRR